MFSVNSVAILMAIIVGLAEAFGQEARFEDQKPAEKKGVIYVSAYIDRLRKIVEKKRIKYESENRLTEQEKSLYRMLLDDKTDPNECEKAVIRYMRERYAAAGVKKPFGTFRLETEYGIGMRGLPACLFWLKGKTSGLYEYSKLTGGLNPVAFIDKYNSFTVIWESPEQKEALMRFALYDFIVSLPRTYGYKYVLGDPPLYHNVPTEELKRVVRMFGLDNNLLSDFVLNYPFMGGGIRGRDFINIDPRYSLPPIPTTEQLLCEYYDQFIISQNLKMRFLSKVKNFYGREKAASLLTHITEEDPLLDESLSFYEQVVQFSIDNRFWQNVTKLIAKPAAQKSKSKIIDMLDQAKREIEKERQAIEMIDAFLQKKEDQLGP